MDTKDFAAKIELERKEKEQKLKEDWVKNFINERQKEIESAQEAVKEAETTLADLKRKYDSILLKSIDEIYKENKKTFYPEVTVSWGSVDLSGTYHTLNTNAITLGVSE